MKLPGCPASCPSLSFIVSCLPRKLSKHEFVLAQSKLRSQYPLSPGRPCKSRLDGKVMGERGTNLANPQAS